MSTHESYVSLETAKLLKRVGFDWGCYGFYGLAVLHNGEYISFDEECELKAEGKESEIEYVDGGMVYGFYHSNKEDEDHGGYSRPTLAVAQRWLREVKSEYVGVHPIVNKWFYSIHRPNFGHFYRDKQFGTYEEAQEAGIEKCLTILLEEKK